jgi:hypothetical protein
MMGISGGFMYVPFRPGLRYGRRGNDSGKRGEGDEEGLAGQSLWALLTGVITT